MSSVEEFIKTRERIEALAKKIILLIQRKAMPESKLRLDEANILLEKLKAMVSNDVQEVVLERLTSQLTTLGTKVNAYLAKRPAKKKQKVAV